MLFNDLAVTMVPKAGIEPATRGFSSRPLAREIKHSRGDCQTGFRAILTKIKTVEGGAATHLDGAFEVIVLTEYQSADSSAVTGGLHV